MSTRNPSRAVAFFLTLALLLPSPALALRQTGLEESSDAGKKELVTALTAPAPGSSASGLEEGPTRREFLETVAGSAAALAGVLSGLLSWDEVLAQAPAGPIGIPIILGLKMTGFGLDTVAGRGGEIVRVTSLGDSGPGTLREALEKKGPRTIVFDIAGAITLTKPLDIRNGNVRISGQTAPGPVVLRGAGDS